MAKQLNLVYIINSLNIGGAEVGMCRLLKGLDPNKYNITILSLSGQKGPLVYRIPSWSHVRFLNVTRRPFIKTIVDFIQITRHADIIVGSLFHSVMIAKMGGVMNPNATIATWRHSSQFKTSFRKNMFKYTTSLCDIILADSDSVAEFLIKDLGIRENLVHTVPIAGIDIDKFELVTHSNSESITVGTVGRLTEAKNYDMVLDIADCLRESNISFKIGGKGELSKKLCEEVKERNLSNISLLGRIDDVATFLSTLDIYLQPSLWEGLCITVLEAMAAGLPVVGSNVGGIGRNVEHGSSGFLYHPNDTIGFVTGIERLADDPRLRMKFGARGRTIVEESFTQEVLSSEFELALEEN